MLVENGVHHASLVAINTALTDAGAVVHFVGPRVGIFTGAGGEKIAANKSMENAPSVLFDALVLPDGSDAIQALADNIDTMAFVKDVFRHGKALLALGAGQELLDMAGIELLTDQNTGVLLSESADAAAIAPAFIKAVTTHRLSNLILADRNR